VIELFYAIKRFLDPRTQEYDGEDG
jgi:hypothetical protein